MENDMDFNSKYYKLYNKLITRARSKTIYNEAYEVHHIIPKSLGGSNNPDNLVKLTFREHYICHKLLTKFTAGVDKQKMVYALWMLTRSNKHHNRILTSHQYEYARTQFKKHSYLKNMSSDEKKAFYENVSTKTKGIPRPWLKNSSFRDRVSKGDAQNPMTKKWKITHPDGTVEIITNLAKFCREHNLSNGNLGAGKSKGYTAECLGKVYC